MISLETVLRRMLGDLVELRAACALVGGLAVSARTEPRFTRDADLAVSVEDDTEAEALIGHLGQRGYRIEAIVEQNAANRLATVRLAVSHVPRAPVVDLLLASSGIEREIVAEAESLDLLADLRIKVARTGHLIALKLLSRDDELRPQDLVDLRALIRLASPDEVDRARLALHLITARGYHRGRQLEHDLDALVDDRSRR